jgi:hypothetical protein
LNKVILKKKLKKFMKIYIKCSNKVFPFKKE